VELDLIGALDLRAEFGDDDTVDADDASLDEGVGLAT
jgi:hypothetical protein